MPWDILVVANPVWETAQLVDRIPEDPEDPDVPTHRDAPDSAAIHGTRVADGGGSALNTACALAMAGRRCLAIGRVGDDAPGRACLDALRRRGVEASCEVRPDRTTKRNTCFVERATHATAFTVELPAHAVPPWEETPDALLNARILLLDRLAANAPAWLQARTDALRQDSPHAPNGTPSPPTRYRETLDQGTADRDSAARREIPINALVRNSAILSPAVQSRLESALPHLGYLQLPEEAIGEAPPAPARSNVMSGSDRDAIPSSTLPGEIRPERSRIHRPRALPPLAAEEVAALLAAGVRVLVRTRGARGVVVQGAGGRVAEIAATPTEIIDPTGAGDAFAAGILDALLDGLDPVEAARRGIDWAARACRYLGARAWLDHEPPG